jgi:hypothetical protein
MNYVIGSWCSSSDSRGEPQSLTSSKVANAVYAVKVIDSNDTPPMINWLDTFVSERNVAAANTIINTASTHVA